MTPSFDQGLDQKRYAVIPRTLIFLFNQNNHVLLLKGSPKKKRWAGLFNGIGGHIEAGEDIIDSAQRELMEETGLSGIFLYLCGQIMIHVTEDTGVALFIFKGQYSGEIKSKSPEGELEWIDMDQLEGLPLVEDLYILLTRVASHQPENKPFIGKYRYVEDGGLDISLR